MAEENQVEPQQVTTEPQQVTKEQQQFTQVTKEPQVQRVTTKNPKKVEDGRRLAESNRKKREAKKQAKLEASRVNQYYGIRLTSLRWIKSFLYYKMDNKSIVNNLYQAAVISVLAVGYSMLGKKILKLTPQSIQKFDLEDTGKLVTIVATSEMTREYLIKQKILPDHINV